MLIATFLVLPLAAQDPAPAPDGVPPSAETAPAASPSVSAGALRERVRKMRMDLRHDVMRQQLHHAQPSPLAPTTITAGVKMYSMFSASPVM